MRKLVGLVVAFGLLPTAFMTGSFRALAQTCEDLPVDPSPMSYRYREIPPRCEGIYRSPVSGNPGMALVSLTYGGVMYDLGRDRDLEISFPVEPADRTLVRGVGLPERLYYRLDAELGPSQTTFKLPLAEVIAREKLLPDQLGLYAYRVSPEGQTAYVPILAHGSGQADRTRVVAVLRSGSDAYDVAWRQYPRGGASSEWVSVASATGVVPEGSRLEIVLETFSAETFLEVSYFANGVSGADRFLLLER